MTFAGNVNPPFAASFSIAVAAAATTASSSAPDPFPLFLYPPLVSLGMPFAGTRMGHARITCHTGDPSTTCSPNLLPQATCRSGGMAAKKPSSCSIFANCIKCISRRDSGVPTAPVNMETAPGSTPAATPTV